jgi:hypothetical protein
MQPGPGAIAHFRDLGDWIGIADVDLTRIGDHDRWPIRRNQLTLKRRQVERADIIARQPSDVLTPQSEHPDRLRRARMHAGESLGGGSVIVCATASVISS